MIELTMNTPAAEARELANRVKKRRLALKMTQAELAQRAGIPLPTYRRFEQTAQISLQGLLSVAAALNALDDFHTLFASNTWSTMDEMLAQTHAKKRAY
ncbi:MAG: helix-turn-helix transcriptional regulator [Paludibacteraceae bacterium]|nr:helix-turn-helix transcriptional regulator [Paludibacteraceae bacterium]